MHSLPRTFPSCVAALTWIAIAFGGVGCQGTTTNSLELLGQRCGNGICGRQETYSSYPQANANLIEDPGFENGPTRELTGYSRPWLGEERNEIFVVNDGTAHTDAQHATLIGPTAQLMQMVDVRPNTGYRVSAFVSGTPGIDQHATQPDWIRGFFVAPRGGVDLDDDGDDGFDGPPYLKAVPIMTGTGEWREIVFTFNSGPNTAVSVNFDARFFSDELLKVDDVSVTEEPEAPPLHPSLSGVAGDRRVDLQWTPYPGTSEYAIWRADTELEFPRLTVRVSCATPPCHFTDDDVINGREYSYQVAVEDGSEVWIFSYDKLLFTPMSSP